MHEININNESLGGVKTKKRVKSIIIKFNGYCLAQKIRESQNYVLLSFLSHLTYIHFVYIIKRGEKMSDYCGKIIASGIAM